MFTFWGRNLNYQLLIINSLPLPIGTSDTFLVYDDSNFTAQPFRHRQFIPKFIIVDYPAIFQFNNSLKKLGTIRKANDMRSTSSCFHQPTLPSFLPDAAVSHLEKEAAG